MLEYITSHLDTILEVIGFVTGLCYLWYEYHANARLWIFSIIMPIIGMVLYFNKGIYADFAINIYYFLIAIYGYAAWTFNFAKKQKEERPIARIKLRAAVVCAAVAVALWLGISYVLRTFTDSTVPYIDAFTTSLSIVAMWMLARKYAEQWLVWIVVDAVSAGLYLYKGIPFYCVLYAIYTVVAYFGYRRWLSKM
ncbi:MAG: nicotinamide riboside transporter PnuC [Muribaculaceae bacterium]